MDRNRIKMFVAMATASPCSPSGSSWASSRSCRPRRLRGRAAGDGRGPEREHRRDDRAADRRERGHGRPEGHLGRPRAKLPSTASMPSFLNQLDSMAATSGTVVTNFTAADAQAYDPAVVAEPTETETQDAAGDTTGGAAATDAPVPADASASPEAPALVTDPSITAANFSTIAISVTVKGSYAAALDFVARIQSGDRALRSHVVRQRRFLRGRGRGECLRLLDHLRPRLRPPGRRHRPLRRQRHDAHRRRPRAPTTAPPPVSRPPGG